MSEDPTPYRTEREKDDLSVLVIVVFGVVGGLVRLSTGYTTASMFVGMAAGYAALLIADQIAMRRGAELVTHAEASKREARERARRPIWSVCLQTGLSVGSAIIIFNLLTTTRSEFVRLPYVLLAAPLLGGAWGMFIALKARWQVSRMSQPD
jgi:hypothetical protein